MAVSPQPPRALSSPWPRTVAAVLCAFTLNVLLLIAFHAAASAADPAPPIINEFVANHAAPSSNDDHEYIEVHGAPDTSYAGYMILAIEGDYVGGAPTDRGTVDGLFSITTTSAAGYWWSGFLPTNSLENGTLTLLLVDGFTGALGQDLDTDDDGHLDATPWTTLLDAIAVRDNGVQDHTYTPTTLPAGFGGSENSPAPGGASRIPDAADTDSVADWALNDFEGEGLPGFSGELSATEARNTPGSRNVRPVRLAVVRSGPGGGSVVSAPAGINCGALCAASFSAYDPITLTAAAQSGSTFAGWGAVCLGSGPCSVALTQPTTITAFFTHSVYLLTTDKLGSGSVTSAPAGIDCGSDCAQLYAHGAAVTLTATPAAGWSFSGWNGACSGTGACRVTMDAAKTVTATFTRNHYDLTVSRVGNGVVTSDPPGIDCGASCVAAYGHGTPVTLAAGADSGWSFAGWGSACTGSAGCTVTLDAARMVTATFTAIVVPPTPATYPLTVATVGRGVVTSDPDGISCGADCLHSYLEGAAVGLAATAEPGWTFDGWLGACNGPGTCAVIMNGAQAVTATFTLNHYTVTVTKVGSGSGTLSGAQGELTCGLVCNTQLAHGTALTLAANADAGSYFDGWSGACAGLGACALTITATTTVTATFTLDPVETEQLLYLPALRH